MNQIQPTPFDYAALNDAQRAAAEIGTTNIRACAKRAGADIIEIGRNLTIVKNALPYGVFGQWLAAEFGMTDRQARRYMSVAEKFTSDKLSEVTITPSALYLLADPTIEPEARDEAVELAKQGETITPAKAKEIANEHAAKKGKPSPVKVKATRKDDEPRTDAPPAPAAPAPTFTDADNPFADEAEPVAAAAEPEPEPEAPAPKPVAESHEWDDYNAQLVDLSKRAESFARDIAAVAGFDAKGQASVPYADGLLAFEGTVGLLRSLKRNLLESRVAGRRGNRFITEREASLTRAVAQSRKVSA